MSKFTIFLGGELSAPDRARRVAADATVRIAADSGARHARTLDLPLHHLVGDFDSIDSALLEELRSEGVKIHRYPPDKDLTDKELALQLAVDLGASEVHLLGNEGGRVDHLLAGITVLGSERYRAVRLWLHGAAERLTAVRGGQSLKLETAPGRRVSLIALSEFASGVHLSGVKWPLADHLLMLGDSLTISNLAAADEISVSVREGTVILCLED